MKGADYRKGAQLLDERADYQPNGQKVPCSRTLGYIGLGPDPALLSTSEKVTSQIAQ